MLLNFEKNEPRTLAICNFLLWIILIYIVYHAISKLLQIICQNFLFQKGVPLFNAFVLGEPVNSRIRNVAPEN